MDKITIVRHSAPTSLDQAPYGSKCIMKHSHHNSYEVHLQISKNTEKPNWDYLGTFNEYSSDQYIEQMISDRLGS